MKQNILISGAGLVGSLLGIMLSRKGYSVTILEKRPDVRKSVVDAGRSINLVVTSRGRYALEQCQLWDATLNIGKKVFGRMIHHKNLTLDYQPYGQDHEFNLSVSRLELNKLLLTAAEKSGVKINFNCDVTGVDSSAKCVSTKDVQKYNYDILFASDGAGSAIRKSLTAQFKSVLNENTDWLNCDYIELFMPALPNEQYAMDAKALHIWPRGKFMMMALANPGGSYTVTLYLPQTGDGVSFESINNPVKAERFFNSEFPDACALIPSYSQNYLSSPRGRLGTIRNSKWVFNDSIALIGDAAHAILPFFGQGMNCGFEDCTELLKFLDESHGNWKSTLERYADSRIPNANAIADMAIENWFEMSEKVADPKFLLRKKVEHILEEKFPNTFKSRYGLVTYSRVPYSQVKLIGEKQDVILNQLCQNIKTPNELNLDLATSMLQSQT